MRLVWSDAAVGDIDRILDHYAEQADTDLATMIDRIDAIPDTLLSNPGIGSLTPSRRWRKWPVKDLPLLLVYDVIDDTVTVLRVVHARSDWAALL
jgi:plasmid stabilization system protein ParE